jgi:hypothetical protein
MPAAIYLHLCARGSTQTAGRRPYGSKFIFSPNSWALLTYFKSGMTAHISSSHSAFPLSNPNYRVIHTCRCGSERDRGKERGYQAHSTNKPSCCVDRVGFRILTAPSRYCDRDVGRVYSASGWNAHFAIVWGKCGLPSLAFSP